jgi:hypothetical protein
MNEEIVRYLEDAFIRQHDLLDRIGVAQNAVNANISTCNASNLHLTNQSNGCRQMANDVEDKMEQCPVLMPRDKASPKGEEIQQRHTQLVILYPPTSKLL